MSQHHHHHHQFTPALSDVDAGEEFGRGAIAAYPRHASSASSSSAASAAAGGNVAPTPSTQRQSTSRSEAQKERVSTACTYCRFRKVKCDGGLPSCSFCQHMGRASECEYAKVSELENQQLRKRKRELRARRAAEKEQQRQQQRKEGASDTNTTKDRRLQQRHHRGTSRPKGAVSPTFIASSSSSSSATAASVMSHSYPPPPSSTSSINSSTATSLSGLPAELANTISPQFLAFLPPHSAPAAASAGVSSHRDIQHGHSAAHSPQHPFPSYTEQQQQQHRQYTHPFHAPHTAPHTLQQQQQQQRGPAGNGNPPGQPFQVFSYERPSGIATSFRAPTPTDTSFRAEYGPAPALHTQQQQHFGVEQPVLDWSFRSFRSFREHPAAAIDAHTVIPTDTFTPSQSEPFTLAKKHAPAQLSADAMGSSRTALIADVDNDVAQSLPSSPSSSASFLLSTSPCSSAWSSTSSPSLAHTLGTYNKIDLGGSNGSRQRIEL